MINIPPENWTLDGWPWPESPQVVINAWLGRMRQSWLSPPESAALPLGESHRLLSDDDAAHAIYIALASLNWAKLVNYETVVVRSVQRGEPFDPPWRTAPWQEYEGTGTSRRSLPRDAIIAELRHILTNELVAGRLVAKGIDPGNPIRGKPFKIPADRLPGLTLDFRESTASSNGQLVAVGITIAALSPPVSKASPISPSVLEKWCVHYKDSHPKPPGQRNFLQAVKDEFGDRVPRTRARDLYNST